ncbi:hypothetical protein JCM3775_002848 [Rhodotorula graminis]
MSFYSAAQQTFLHQARALVRDLRSFAPVSDLAACSHLNYVERAIDGTVYDWLPLERDAIMDALLALLCDACAQGSLDFVSSGSAASLWRSVAVATPPEPPDVNIPHVWRHISDAVTALTKPYKSPIGNWRRDFKNGISHDKLRRLDVHAQTVLVGCFTNRTRGL